ncbi:MAG TPA: phosphotransferase [Actinomycetes bacterium]|nr:phosphotransferase [Actinomycetes bacterium]
MTSEVNDVLDCLRPVLADHLEPSELGALVVQGGVRTRRRSSLYFVGIAGRTPTYRWVVKQPNSTSQQHDLPSPMSSAGQYAALQRLHEHFRLVSTGVSTPDPVAQLPTIDAYVMEFVAGPTLTELIGPRALLRPNRLVEGIRSAGLVLQEIHSLEPAETVSIDVDSLADESYSRARKVLMDHGIPTRESWFPPRVPSPGGARAEGARVVQHGDFAPENILLSPSGVVCLEPELAEKDWAERDVSRFVLMLFDAPFFVVGVDVPAVQRLRRRAAATFLDAYYGELPRPDTLRLILVESLAARWATRSLDLVERAPRLESMRSALLRRYFTGLMDELRSPDWL